MARKGGVTLTHLLFGAHPLTSELQQTWNQGLANHRGVRPRPGRVRNGWTVCRVWL